MKTIADRINERRVSLYVEACSRFGTSYKYVWQIARGERKATRGKGRDIKEWLEQQISK